MLNSQNLFKNSLRIFVAKWVIMHSMNNRLTQTTPEVPEEVEIQTSTLRLVAKCWGKPEGLPVLALHGWLDNAATFDHLAPFLPEFRLVSLDLPGHGFSDHRPIWNVISFHRYGR